MATESVNSTSSDTNIHETHSATCLSWEPPSSLLWNGKDQAPCPFAERNLSESGGQGFRSWPSLSSIVTLADFLHLS